MTSSRSSLLHVGRRGQARPIGRHVLLVAVAAYFLLPLWWLVVAATKGKLALFSAANGPFWFDNQVALGQNLVEMSTHYGGIFWRWMANSALYACAGGIGATVIALLAGYGFSKFRFPGRNALYVALLASIMVPVTALTIPTFVLVRSAGLIDTIWAVILPSLLSPIGVYLMRVYVDAMVPDELIDAARVDGAGELSILLRVAVPILRPAIVTVLLLSAVATWNNYFLPLVMLSDVRLLPVTVGLERWLEQASVTSGAGETLWNLVITGSLVSIVPIVLAFLALQRYWKAGLALGALK